MAEWGKIDRIRERMTLTERGDLVKKYHIEATTAKGIVFTFDVGEDEIDPEIVDRLAREKAEKLDSLLAL